MLLTIALEKLYIFVNTMYNVHVHVQHRVLTITFGYVMMFILILLIEYTVVYENIENMRTVYMVMDGVVYGWCGIWTVWGVGGV